MREESTPPDKKAPSGTSAIIARPAVIQRLLTQTVADQMQAILLAVKEREREHTCELPDCSLHTIPLDCCKHHFGVGLTSKANALTLECSSQLEEVINLAVED